MNLVVIDSVVTSTDLELRRLLQTRQGHHAGEARREEIGHGELRLDCESAYQIMMPLADFRCSLTTLLCSEQLAPE